MIQVNCVGPDLNNEQSGLVDYKYEWQLNLPKELELHCQLLLKTTFSLMSKTQ